MQTKESKRRLIILSALLIGISAGYLLSPYETQTALADADLDNSEHHRALNKQTQKNAVGGLSPQAEKQAIESIPKHSDEAPSEMPIERIRAIQNKTELHQALLEDHTQFSRYPAYNQRFESEESDPVLARYVVDERSTDNPEDGTQLTIWSDKKYYLSGDRANLFATLRDQNGKPINTQFMAQVIYNEQVNLQTFTFEDGDQDGIYEYSLPLNSESGENWQAGVYKILIINKTNPLSDALTFILSRPDIELSGQFRDSVSKRGELIIEAEVLVATENRYYLQASLYSANQIAIGATQQAMQLSPGTHWVKLVFDGGLIRDSAESSPFLLKHISLAKVSLPIQRAPMRHAEYFTQEYASQVFQTSSPAPDDAL